MLTLINKLEIKCERFSKLEYSKTRAIFLHKNFFKKKNMDVEKNTQKDKISKST